MAPTWKTRHPHRWVLAWFLVVAASSLASGQTPPVPDKRLPESVPPAAPAVGGTVSITTTAVTEPAAPQPPIVPATAPPPVPVPVPTGRFAGIEIGAKGVKAIVMEMGPSGVATKLETIANTTLSQGVVKSGSYLPEAIADTAEEAGKFAAQIRDEHQVAADHVIVIGSSGLPKASNRDDLVKAVAEATKLAPMSFILPTEEVKLTIKGSLIDRTDRAGGLVVDIGSGNTKGGFLRSDAVVDFSIPLGSVTFENRAAQEVTATKKPFPEVAAGLRPTVLEAEFARQINAYPELAARETVYLSGGAVYALVSLLKPEAASEGRVALTKADIEAYYQLVHTTPITPPTLDDVKDAAAKKEVKNVLDNFTATNLMAGSELLTALATTLDFGGKKLFFDRTALMAVIRGKVLELASKSS